MTTSDEARNSAVAGLLKRIDDLVKAGRPSNEIAKTVEVMMDLLESYVDEDVTKQFYEELASRLTQ